MEQKKDQALSEANSTIATARAATRYGLNLPLSTGVALAVLGQLFLLPLAVGAHTAVMACLILLLIPVNLPFWSLIHEGIHKNIHANRKMNEAVARGMSVLFGIPFAVLRFGHLMHHQYNREWETELYADKHNRFVVTLTHYAKMLGGLWISEVLASLAIALLPAKLLRTIYRLAFKDDRHYQGAIQSLLKPQTLLRIRIDMLLITLVYTAAFFAFGAHWGLLLLLIGGRAFTVSMMDNAYHYDTPADNSVPAKELKAPGFLASWLLNFNHHRTHHRHPALGWRDLRDRHRVNGEAYDEPIGHAVLAQFRGPIRSDS
jgi:fatty acid desaturase